MPKIKGVFQGRDEGLTHFLKKRDESFLSLGNWNIKYLQTLTVQFCVHTTLWTRWLLSDKNCKFPCAANRNPLYFIGEKKLQQFAKWDSNFIPLTAFQDKKVTWNSTIRLLQFCIVRELHYGPSTSLNMAHMVLPCSSVPQAATWN